MTLSSSLKSDLPQSSADEEEGEETDGALASWPFIQWPHPSFLLSPGSRQSGSGPSMSGESVSPMNLMLPDLVMEGGGGGGWWLRLRRRDIGEALLALDLEGERPRTTSSFSAEKKPCLFSISLSLSLPPTSTTTLLFEAGKALAEEDEEELSLYYNEMGNERRRRGGGDTRREIVRVGGLRRMLLGMELTLIIITPRIFSFRLFRIRSIPIILKFSCGKKISLLPF